MAAIGLIPELRIQDDADDGGSSAITAIIELTEYIFAMREKLSVGQLSYYGKMPEILE